jgi:hypothetical protein
MKQMFAAFAAVAIIALGLGACGAPDSGAITGKRYIAPSSHTEQHCSLYNTNGTCRFYTYNTVQDPEEYQLKLNNGKDEGWRNVSAAEYLKYHKGGQYP